MEAAGQAVEDECKTLGKKMFTPIFINILISTMSYDMLNTKHNQQQNTINITMFINDKYDK